MTVALLQSIEPLFVTFPLNVSEEFSPILVVPEIIKSPITDKPAFATTVKFSTVALTLKIAFSPSACPGYVPSFTAVPAVFAAQLPLVVQTFPSFAFPVQ